MRSPGNQAAPSIQSCPDLLVHESTVRKGRVSTAHFAHLALGRTLPPFWCQCVGTTARAHWVRSRTTSAGLLSSRSPRKRGCRSRASLVHSANPI